MVWTEVELEVTHSMADQYTLVTRMLQAWLEVCQ